MENFNKEEVFDIITHMIVSCNNQPLSKQLRIYSDIMDYLQKIADTQFELGYMKAMEVSKELNQN